MLTRYRLYCWTLFLLLASLGTGCQKEQPYGLVEGTVTLDGKPLADVEVVFMPDPEKGTKGHRSVALVDKEGHYQIVSDAGRPGTPIGFHRVCINDLLAAKGPGAGAGVTLPEDDPQEGAGTKGPIGTKALTAGAGKPKSRFPSAYTSASETPFRDIEVTEGTQVINLALRSK
jgi:hypothetical protein